MFCVHWNDPYIILHYFLFFSFSTSSSSSSIARFLPISYALCIFFSSCARLRISLYLSFTLPITGAERIVPFFSIVCVLGSFRATAVAAAVDAAAIIVAFVDWFLSERENRIRDSRSKQERIGITHQLRRIIGMAKIRKGYSLSHTHTHIARERKNREDRKRANGGIRTKKKRTKKGDGSHARL